jgi:hypothetical protein
MFGSQMSAPMPQDQVDPTMGMTPPSQFPSTDGTALAQIISDAIMQATQNDTMIFQAQQQAAIPEALQQVSPLAQSMMAPTPDPMAAYAGGMGPASMDPASLGLGA